ncbi:MAG TPA: CPBP family intramembrane glutamic endopeptidase [Gemmatimonadaceae bacterium]|nr:CPBP family intramembrane glutamic endopeptidase [Gemmatimonadaceae bacterium]
MPSRLLSFTKRGSYFDVSRAPRYSVVFALPLLIAYEALAAALSGPTSASQIRNGADVLLKEAFIAVAGRNGPLIFIASVIAIGIWFVARDIKRTSQGIRPVIFGGMLAEAIALAAIFGVVIGTLTTKLLGSLHVLSMLAVAPGPIAHMSWPTKLMLSLGAGLYEELLFRVLLVSALAALGRVVFGFGVKGAGVFATIVGALIFSAFHYVGPFGDPFSLTSFTFRAISGVAFSALYLLRGFGITAWTHALYDAFLLLG